MLPNFLIIGAPRSGTTWLAMNLRAHPEVFMPRIKEVHFFDRHFDEGKAFYEDYFTGATGFNVVGEATPDYMYTPEVPERIHGLLPDSKLILTLRNPVDRVYSRYLNSAAMYEENRGLSFEEKLEQKELFLEEGMYYTHLRRYYEWFPKEQFLIHLYEDIQERPLEVLKKTYEFLGVAPEFVPPTLEQRVNAAGDKPFHAKSSALYYLSRVLQELRLTKLASAVQNRNATTVDEMKPTTRRWLVEDVYRDENRKLQDLTGLDVSGWV